MASANTSAAAAAADAPAAAAAPHIVAATPALRADVERVASLLDDWGRRYQSRDWRPALAAARAARDEVQSLFERLAALSDPAELLSAAAPLGATGFRWAAELPMGDRFIECPAFHALGRALRRAGETSGVAETVRASCDFGAGIACGTMELCDGAFPLLERALAVRERALGAGSREALDVRHALGQLRFETAEWAEAEPQLKAAYDGRKRLLGPNHPATLHSLQYLAMTLHSGGKAAAGEALLGVALAGLEAALGPSHPFVLATLNNLGTFYVVRRDPAAAEALFRRSLEGCVDGLGEPHKETRVSRLNLAHCLLRLERPSEAEPLFRRAAERNTEGADDEDAVRAEASVQVVECMVRTERYAQALARARSIAKTVGAALGKSHPSSTHLVLVTAEALAGLGRMQEAGELAAREHPRLCAELGPDDSRTRALALMMQVSSLGGRGRQR
jgi:tetratricopeptide (TPR) repeat protein